MLCSATFVVWINVCNQAGNSAISNGWCEDQVKGCASGFVYDTGRIRSLVTLPSPASLPSDATGDLQLPQIQPFGRGSCHDRSIEQKLSVCTYCHWQRAEQMQMYATLHHAIA